MNIHRSIRTAALLPIIALLLGLLAAAPAQAAATGRILAEPCLKMRSSAKLTGTYLGVCIPYRATVTIGCTVRGDYVSGPYGRTNIWDRVSYGGKTGYIADALVYTGTNGPAAGTCSTSSTSSLSSKVDAFVSKWNGRYADFDGAYGAQCFDLFNFYNRDVIRAARAGGMGAYQIYDTYDKTKYYRVSASSTPRKGDVAVWSSSYPYGGGYGHVAIVLGASGSGFKALTQNPGATKTQYFSKSYLRGFLRPRT